MISRYLVSVSYFLSESAGYRKIKSSVYDLLENPQSAARPYFDTGMIALILLSVFLLIYEVRHTPSVYTVLFEQAAVAVFIVEYLLRVWVCSDNHRIVIEEYEKAAYLNARFRLGTAFRRVVREKWAYVSTPLAIIDLLAILPSYRPLRILRIFLLFRVFKLFRYARSVTEFNKVLAEKRFELYTLGMFVGFVVFASATAIYLFEAHKDESQVNTFFDAIYWSLVTISTVGYGDITPQSTEGRLIALVLIMSGIGVISFSTSIMVSAFAEKLQELRDRRVFSTLEKTEDVLIVCGYGRVGEIVVDKLVEDRRAFVIIDKDEQKIARALKRGYAALCDDPANGELLEQIGIRKQGGAVLCITSDDVANVFITLTARHLNPAITIISRANRVESVKKLRLAGADYVVKPYEAAALVAVEQINQPVASKALSDILNGEKGMTLDAVPVARGSFGDDRRLSDMDFHRQKLVLIGVIVPQAEADHRSKLRFDLPHGRFYFNPDMDFVLHHGHILVVLGRSVSVADFKDRLEKSALKMRKAGHAVA